MAAARTWTTDTTSATGLVSKSRLATNLAGYVPKTTTLTINGSVRDLSVNRTWNVGTVLSVTPAYGLTPQTAITSSGTFRVDTAAVQTVLNFFPKGDTRWAKGVGNAVTTMGAFGSTPNANGASISGNTLPYTRHQLHFRRITTGTQSLLVKHLMEVQFYSHINPKTVKCLYIYR
jgi:hypothetical protein